MEMVSYIANEPWSDHPKCSCPVLTEYAIRMNDQFNDEHRQLLKPLIPLLVGTRVEDDKIKIKRKQLILWRNVTATYPMILDTIKLPALATKLREYKNTVEGMNAAAEFLKENKKKIYANSNAYAYANSNTYTYANAYAYANSNAYAYAYADAYAYANAKAYAYANAYRKRIAEESVDTLRLAMEVKPCATPRMNEVWEAKRTD